MPLSEQDRNLRSLVFIQNANKEAKRAYADWGHNDSEYSLLEWSGLICNYACKLWSTGRKSVLIEIAAMCINAYLAMEERELDLPIDED